MKKINRIQRLEKQLFAAAAIVVVVAMMMGGTYAWMDFTQAKTNKFRGFADADVTLHDEFDGENKDVFVENSGSSVIYARIRLDEYMEVGGVSFVPEAEVRDKNTWAAHTYDGECVEDCEHADEYHLFHAYYTWEMSGAQRKFLKGTPGLVYSKLGDDGLVDADPEEGLPTAAAAAPMKLSEYFALKDKADSKAPMTSEEDEKWEAATTTGCWLLDDTPGLGGWAYWSMPLLPGTATNLLLDSVTRTGREPDDDWFYGIDVKLQAVTENDFGKWSENGFTASPAALQLIGIWNAAPAPS